MKIIIIGSSNAARFTKYLDEEEKKLTEMRKCTKLESFKVQMEELEEADPANILLQDLVQRLALLLSLKGMEDGEKTTLSKKNS